MATPNDASLYVAKEDAGRYKCALCMDSSFKHQYLAIQHVNRVHLGNFVVYKPNTVEARFIPMCKKGCSVKGHYHCFKCKGAFRKSRLVNHIDLCQSVVVSSSPSASANDFRNDQDSNSTTTSDCCLGISVASVDDKAEIDMTAAEYSISSPPVTTSDVCVGISGASVDDKAEIDMTAAEVSISSPSVKRKK